jgi:hypothetical protein
MASRNKFDLNALRKLPPGMWVWESGIGYRRNASGTSGTWYIK